MYRLVILLPWRANRITIYVVRPTFGGSSSLPRQEPQVGQACSLPVSPRSQRDRARCVAYVIDGLFRIGFRLDQTCSRGSVTWRIFLYRVRVVRLFICSPARLSSLCAAPCPAPSARRCSDAYGRSFLYFLSVFCVQQFPAAVSSPYSFSLSISIWKSRCVYNKK